MSKNDYDEDYEGEEEEGDYYDDDEQELGFDSQKHSKFKSQTQPRQFESSVRREAHPSDRVQSKPRR